MTWNNKCRGSIYSAALRLMCLRAAPCLLLVTGEKPRPVPTSAGFQLKDVRLLVWAGRCPSLTSGSLLPALGTQLQLLQLFLAWLVEHNWECTYFSQGFLFSTCDSPLKKILVDLSNMCGKSEMWYMVLSKPILSFSMQPIPRTWVMFFTDILTELTTQLQKLPKTV